MTRTLPSSSVERRVVSRNGRATIVVVFGAGALGLAASIVLAALPWPAPILPLPAWVLPIMALAGTGILVVATRCPPGTVRVGVFVLGLAVLFYPLPLGAACAGLFGESGPASAVLMLLAMTGHVIPLVMLQLLPVLAMRSVAGVPGRWAPWLIIIVNAADEAMVIAANTLPTTAQVLAPLSSILWIGIAGFAPIVTWIAVSRTAGQIRHRAVLIAISSVISVLILAFCFVLGLSERVQQMGAEPSLALLMIGFSAATMSGAALVARGLGSGTSWWLSTRVLGRLLAGVLLGAVALAAVIFALIGAGAVMGAWGAVFAAVALGLAAGVGATRLHGWTTRIVDPVAELRSELSAAGGLTDGTVRERTERALQRAVNDPQLRLVISAAESEPNLSGPVTAASGPARIALTPDEGAAAPRVFAEPSTPASARRVRRMADLSSLMWAVVLEAEVSRARARADVAAAAERERLSRNLHDGLQSRLLGIALRLQLEGNRHPDPMTRGLVDETVASLRSAANEARVLAEGSVPDALQRGGLKDAVHEFVGGLESFVQVDIPAQRYPGPTEETGYFVVGEAVGNAIKHGTAHIIGVHVRRDERVLTVTVTDDGCGGADPRAGSGLRRLSERVAASGGILTVRDAQPHGTIVEALLPCGS
jgi:signal transduction histidine kinase